MDALGRRSHATAPDGVQRQRRGGSSAARGGRRPDHQGRQARRRRARVGRALRTRGPAAIAPVERREVRSGSISDSRRQRPLDQPLRQWQREQQAVDIRAALDRQAARRQ